MNLGDNAIIVEVNIDPQNKQEILTKMRKCKPSELLELNHQQEQQRLMTPSLQNQPALQALKKQYLDAYSLDQTLQFLFSRLPINIHIERIIGHSALRQNVRNSIQQYICSCDYIILYHFCTVHLSSCTHIIIAPGGDGFGYKLSYCSV